MTKFSSELLKVIDLAKKTYYYCSQNAISSVNLLLSMAMEKSCLAYEVLSRLGLDYQKARSFVLEIAPEGEFSLSYEAEEVFQHAKKVAKECGYKNICSHHLLLAVVTLNHKSVRQILWDFDITADKITAAVNAINYYGIGLDESGDKYSTGKNIKISGCIKNKELEREILKHLKNDIYN
ncbi:MAG: Clp protease N-terminal domain-containing protein [Bacillota bacterium]